MIAIKYFELQVTEALVSCFLFHGFILTQYFNLSICDSKRGSEYVVEATKIKS